MLSRRLSVVVPTHNKRRSLMKTLASLEQCDRAGRDIEVIVVDDASKDGTGTHLDGLQIGLPCKRLRNEQGLGPAASRNLGARQSAGELLLFLDDDMVCEPGLIRAHLVHHAFCADVAVVGRALYHPDLKRTALTRFFDAQHLRHSSPTCPPLRFSSNNVSLSRSLFERVGGFEQIVCLCRAGGYRSRNAAHSGSRLRDPVRTGSLRLSFSRPVAARLHAQN